MDEMDAIAIELVAKVAHEANRAWCEACGDHTQVAWEAAPQWQRDSCINGVRFVLANRDAGDAAQHENWRAEKYAAGWVWGPVKDPDRKVHPCMVPFQDLPPHQQAKDRLFRSVVLALAGS